MSKISIIIPCFNSGNYLQQTLESLLQQSLSLQIILIDGGSTDNTKDIIKDYEKYLYFWRSQPDAGQADAINIGLTHATGEFVSWLNADDVLWRDSLVHLQQALLANPQAAVAYGKAYFVDNNKRITGKYFTHAFYAKMLRYRCFIAQPASLIRRSALLAMQGINQELFAALDYDLWCRLYLATGPFVYVPEFIAATRLHRQAKSYYARALQYRESMKVVKQHFGYIPLKWYLYYPFSVYLRHWFYSIH